MPKRILKNKIGFFASMLLFSSALIILFFLGANLIIYSISSKYEEYQYLKNYELAMINLSEIAEDRYQNFHVLSGKLLIRNQINPAISEFLESGSDIEVTPLIKKDCLDFLRDLCNDDQHLRGFLLYSFNSGSLYYYSTSTTAFPCVSMSQEELGIKPFTDISLGIEKTNKLVQLCTSQALETYSFYGFVATIFNNPTKPLGYLIPLYHTGEFYNVLNRFDLDENCVFTISNKDNQLLFNSALYGYHDLSDSYSGSSTDRYQNKVSYYVNRPSWSINSFTAKIGMITVGLSLLIFILFYVAYYLSKKNIEHILIGMKKFGLADLTYRIPTPSANNEFTQIIDGFNNMCNELQRSVELTYLYEIQQKRSELYALQTSINPHFLYNILEMIRSQIVQGDYNASSKMLLLLSKVHRSQTNTRVFVPIEYDMEICENLMELYQSRFQNFDYELHLEDDAAPYGIPKNTIQPFLENYFVHGIVPDRDDNMICINITSEHLKEGKYIHFSIFNNGKTISRETIDKIHTRLEESIYNSSENEQGFALANVYKRLKIVFQSDCSMTVGTYTEHTGFKVDILIPARTIKELENYMM